MCGLYRAFLADALITATMTSAETIAFHYYPTDAEKIARAALKKLKLGARNEQRFIFTPQSGETFTERIEHSFNHAKNCGGEELVMIGSDAPLLRPEALDDAFEFIYSKSGMALGPSGEGGVYMIGFPAGAPIDFGSVFNDGAEIENLIDIAKQMNMPAYIGPETLDVDVVEDLITLIGIIRAKQYQRKFGDVLLPLNTCNAIEKLDLRIARNDSGTRGKILEVGDG